MADLEQISPKDRLFDLIDLTPSPQSLELNELFDLWCKARAAEEVPAREKFVHWVDNEKTPHSFEFALRVESGSFMIISSGKAIEGLIDGATPGSLLEDMTERRLAVYLRRLFCLAVERHEAIGAWFTLPTRKGQKLHVEAIALPVITASGEWRVLGGLIPTP